MIGLAELMGQNVTFFCVNYIVAGKLVAFSDTDAKLEDASIVYETGLFSNPEWKDASKFPNKYWYVNRTAVETFGILK